MITETNETELRTNDELTNTEPPKPRKSVGKKPGRKIRLITMAALTLILASAAILLLTNRVSASAYYTVDINPSICLDVDENEIVIAASYQNEDGRLLLESLDLVGLSAPDAITQIITAAQQAGYITQDKYILIGKFSDDAETNLTDLQAQLETNFGDLIHVLVISGSMDDKENADEQNVSAGLLKLSQTVEGVEVSSDDKVEDVLTKVGYTSQQSDDPTSTAEYTVSGTISGEAVKLTWTQSDSANFSGYKVVASTGNPNPKYPDDGYIKYITDINTTGISLYEGTGGLSANTSYYFSITYLYSDGTSYAANAVKLTVPKKTASSGSSYIATTVAGSISGNTVSLSWDKITNSSLDGYKVMYSFTDSTPVYGESGCDYKYWITDASTTSCTIDVTTLNGFSSGAVCYFSITALYDSHSVKMPGNTISFTMPTVTVAPYISTTVSGSITDTTVSLNWDKITHSQFDGYKVMYSFTDSTPVYGESGCDYKYWITDANTTSCTIDVTTLNGYTEGATCYFSITVLYNGHAVKEAGNTISFVMPVSH